MFLLKKIILFPCMFHNDKMDISAYTVKPVLSGHSKRESKLVFKTAYRLMQVKSIAECSKRAFCNTFDLH